MNIHAISKSVVLYFVLLFITMSILIFNEFELTERLFTLFLMSGMFLISIYTGRVADNYPALNGFLVGLITSTLLIFFISAYNDMYWELNFMILVTWVGITTVGSYIGGRVRKLTSVVIQNE